MHAELAAGQTAALRPEHRVQFYESASFLVQRVAEFLAQALSADGAAVVLATAAHRAELERLLTAAGVDLPTARAAGRYTALDAADALARILRDGRIDEDLFREAIGGLVGRAASGGRRAHIFGELVALLVDAGDRSGAVQLERLWNDLQARQRFSLFCGYPISGFAGESFARALSDVCAEHTHVGAAESYSALTDPDAREREVAALQQRAHSLEAALASERAARAEAEAAVRAREEFLSIAAHELKTPITAILGHAQVSLRRLQRHGAVPPAELTESLEAVAQQAQRMGVLTAHLLNVARLERGELRLDRRDVDVAALVRGAVDALPADRSRYPVTVTAPDRLLVWADPLRLQQVVSELLDNAVRYSPRGGAIHVTLERVSPPSGAPAGGHGSARITVTDHGVGVPDGLRERVFERFYRAHASAGNAGYALGGLGLGLYLARQIVELHGGTITHEPPPDGQGAGARCVVSLPALP